MRDRECHGSRKRFAQNAENRLLCGEFSEEARMSAGWPYLEFEVELVGDGGAVLVPRVWRRFQLRRTASLDDLAETLIDMCVWEAGFEYRFERGGGLSAALICG